MDEVKPMRFKLRDRVRVILWPNFTGTIIALRGPLGPNRENVYRMRTRDKSNPGYTIVMEHQIELVPPPGVPDPATRTEPVAAEDR